MVIGLDAELDTGIAMNLMLGDCLERMKEIPDGSVDLTVTSPPYDNLRTYAGTLEWNFDIFKQVANELYRVTKDGGVVVWVVGDATIKGSETGTSFKQALCFKEIGFNLHDTMIYQKNKAHVYDPRQHRYKQSFEYMFVFSKGKPKTYNPLNDIKNKEAGKIKKVSQRLIGGRLRKDRIVKINDFQDRSNIWMYETGINSTPDKIAFEHPAVFPEKLAEDHILSWSNEGDTVLDCFMGSGTTGKMALLNNRKFIGIEKDAGYFEIAKQRLCV